MLYDQIIEVIIILFIRFVLILPQENLQHIHFSENIDMFYSTSDVNSLNSSATTMALQCGSFYCCENTPVGIGKDTVLFSVVLKLNACDTSTVINTVKLIMEYWHFFTRGI